MFILDGSVQLSHSSGEAAVMHADGYAFLPANVQHRSADATERRCYFQNHVYLILSQVHCPEQSSLKTCPNLSSIVHNDADLQSAFSLVI